MKHSINKIFALVFLFSLMCITGFAQDAAKAATTVAANAPQSPYLTLRYVLVGIAILFLFIIIMLGRGIKAGVDIAIDKSIAARKAKSAATVLLLMISLSGFAQDAATATAAAPKAPGMPTDIYIFLAVVIVEFIVIIAQVLTLYNLFGVREQKLAAEQKELAGKPKQSFFERINKTVSVEEEETLDMKHNYDGIRELDNKVPGWWSMAFYASILFGIIYLFRMFWSQTLPDQFAELAKDKEIAAIHQAEYLKNSSNNVDENTVKMLDAAGIENGAKSFATHCVACHGDKGQGNAVGPNLTDDYWIHKGGLHDIFYSIKYGWPDKGMKSWKEDFSPVQIAELASFVKSLHGTNPPGAKEKQGDLWTEDGAAAPATPAGTEAPKADSATAK